MCKGLAVIVEKIDNKWKCHAIKGESSHDKVLHTLSYDLRYGKKPHLKFEILFPNMIKDDIQQSVEYPNGFVEIQFGKKIAAHSAFYAVQKYYNDNYLELSQFTNKMLSNADLHCVNLSSTDLHGANLHHADLSGANLFGANLSGADLHHADLSGANLFGANLFGADLFGADLHGANLHGANLSYANLHGADLSDADLSDADLRGANLLYADLRGAEYNECTRFPENFEILDSMVLS